MNDIFKQYLRKFLLVFFYDILIYSQDLNTHLSHLHMILLTMLKNQNVTFVSKRLSI